MFDDKLSKMEEFVEELQSNLINQHKNQIEEFDLKIANQDHQIKQLTHQLQSRVDD